MRLAWSCREPFVRLRVFGVRTAAAALGIFAVFAGCSSVPTYRLAGDGGVVAAADAAGVDAAGLDAQAPGPDAATHVYLTFVTKAAFTGAIGAPGLDSGQVAAIVDAKCKDAWNAKVGVAGLPDDPRVWRALVYSSATQSPLDTVVPVEGGWHLPAAAGPGPSMFADLAALRSGIVTRPFVDEYGNEALGFAWVGYLLANAPLERCGEWRLQDNAASGAIGLPTSLDAWFYSGGRNACDQRGHIYCLEQPRPAR